MQQQSETSPQLVSCKPLHTQFPTPSLILSVAFLSALCSTVIREASLVNLYIPHCLIILSLLLQLCVTLLWLCIFPEPVPLHKFIY